MTNAADTHTESEEVAIAAAISESIARLRRTHRLSFDALAERSGVSKGTVVQIERQRANPSISTLCRLAAALDVSVADLVAPAASAAKAVTLIPSAAMRQLWTGPKGGSAKLVAGTPGPDMLELWSWTLLPGERYVASGHGRGTRELVHVTGGLLGLEVNGLLHLIPAGSAAVALTDCPHAYGNPGTAPLRFTMAVHEPPAGA